MVAFCVFVVLMAFIVTIVYWSVKIGISPTPSSKRVALEICEVVKRSDKTKIVDLGSGWGGLALTLAMKNPHKEVLGVELSPIPYYYSIILKRFMRIENLNFIRADFTDVKFNGDELLVCYLFPRGMEGVKKILQKNHTLISQTFALREVKPTKQWQVDNLFRTPIFIYDGYGLA